MPRGGINQTYLPRIENKSYAGGRSIDDQRGIPTTASFYSDVEVGPKVIKNPYVK